MNILFGGNFLFVVVLAVKVQGIHFSFAARNNSLSLRKYSAFHLDIY
jgi:hypothetical protein